VPAVGSEDDEDLLMTPTQVKDWLGVSPATLRRWRVQGIGPAYIQPSPRVIRYRRSAVLAWLEEQEKSSPSP
jgi:predicted site-specific integrase-resolvase